MSEIYLYVVVDEDAQEWAQYETFDEVTKFNFREIIKSGEYVEAKFCYDCHTAYHHSVDEVTDPDSSWDPGRFLAVWSEYEILDGHFAEYAHPGEECDEDGECSRGFYHSRECEGCGSTVGGDRQDMILIERALFS